MPDKIGRINRAIARMEHVRSQYEILATEETNGINKMAYREYVDDYDCALEALRDTANQVN